MYILLYCIIAHTVHYHQIRIYNYRISNYISLTQYIIIMFGHIIIHNFKLHILTYYIIIKPDYSEMISGYILCLYSSLYILYICLYCMYIYFKGVCLVPEFRVFKIYIQLSRSSNYMFLLPHS